MRPARLHFFNEQDAPELEALFADAGVVRHLQALGAGVTMGLRDLSDGRARVVRHLADEGIPVGAWLLLPREQGYFATLDNGAEVAARYDEVHAWARHEGLVFESVGLDFEPDLHELGRLVSHPLRTLGAWAWRSSDRVRLERARDQYGALMRRMRHDGRRVETYQFPVVLEERAARGSFWQRFVGSLDVEADREVVMLYSSLLGPLGASVVEAWAPKCRAIGVGSTGGGIDPLPKLTWEALEHACAWRRARVGTCRFSASRAACSRASSRGCSTSTGTGRWRRRRGGRVRRRRRCARRCRGCRGCSGDGARSWRARSEVSRLRG